MFGFSKKKIETPPPTNTHQQDWGQGYVLRYFDGEKNRGELGAPRRYELNFESLANRSWAAFLDDPTIGSIIDRYLLWTVGVGLRLQCEPIPIPLISPNFNRKEFTKNVESYWRLFNSDKEVDVRGERTLGGLANQAYKTAIVGGNCLVNILDDEGTDVKIQLIDGQLIGSGFYKNNLNKGEKNTDGIIRNQFGKVVAFIVRGERLERFNQEGFEVVLHLKGAEYKIDTNKGIPITTRILEIAKKHNRFVDATLGAAEENANITYTFERKIGASNETPMASNLRNSTALGRGKNCPKAPDTITSQELEQRVATTTNKTAIDLPEGVELKGHRNDSTVNFTEFNDAMINLIAGSLSIPPDVARMLFTSSYSASRAAIKDWEHTLNIKRDAVSTYFYKPIYEFWLHKQITKLTISSIDYLNGNRLVKKAITGSRWVGARVPHIDPRKEVLAVRSKLGKRGDNMPLTTVSQATEELNGGDSESNLLNFEQEYENFSLSADEEVITEKND